MRLPTLLPSILLAAPLLVAGATPLSADEPSATPAPRTAGPTDKGFLLPNGWTITPAGNHLQLTDLPLNILPLADGRRALVTTNGYNAHELSLVDLAELKVIDKEAMPQSWFGLAANTDQSLLWWSGGGSKRVFSFRLNGDELSKRGAVDHNIPDKDDAAEGADHGFKSGLALDPMGKRLFALDINAGTLSVIAADGDKDQAVQIATLGGRPYDLVFARNGERLYVSDWAGARVLAVDPTDLRVVDKIVVGEHPNQMALHPQDDRLFVACASANAVAVIDTRRGVVIEHIATSLFPRAPEGATPDALAISPDGHTLFVANADNNCVALVDIEEPGESAVRGFIPTGWYPTALAVTRDGKQLLVGVGKGLQTRPNPIYRDDATAAGEKPKSGLLRNLPWPYIGTTISGALSRVDFPNEAQLAAYTEQVYRNCPYSDQLLSAAPYAEPSAIPTRVGDPSPITHVIYIIKENRTYDQVFGDLPQGNGDPSLVMFGQDVTPNQHKLATEFVLLDNLYCNGQVSRDGHPWSTSAYNTDYIARDWMLTYSGREGVEDDEERNLSNPPGGYIWDACARAGVSYRSYGEYGRRVSQPDGSLRVEGGVPGLVGHVCPDYGVPKAPNEPVRDTHNVDTFLREFAEYEKNDNLPRFIIMSLGEDHTRGTSPGAFTPQACVASNDLALGRLVEAVSKSKYWPKLAIFVIEDDAQNGPDHVDAHRTIGLAISPYIKRHSVDSTQYSTSGVLRTIELILGLPPMSQFDAAATPMFRSFSAQADLTPYTHEPARIDVNARNTAMAYGAERSSRMDFSEYDRINDFELNEILWYAIKGRKAPQPPYVRRAIAYRNLARSEPPNAAAN